MISKKAVIEAILDGIIEANDFFEKITAGAWLNDAGVESVLQTKISESLYNILPQDENGWLCEERLMLEYQLKGIIAESGSGKRRGRIPSLVGGSKRADLLIVDKNEKPLIPIEIKRNAAAPGFADDAVRIIGILSRSDKIAGGSVKYGIICGFLFGKGDSKSIAAQMVKNKRDQSYNNISDKLSDQ